MRASNGFVFLLVGILRRTIKIAAVVVFADVQLLLLTPVGFKTAGTRVRISFKIAPLGERDFYF